MIAVYSRKSKFTGKGESIENQIELCKQYINNTYENAEVKIYEDEGFSGKNTERPQFKQMMRDAREGRFSAVVCYRLDRISRNIGDFAKLIEELEELRTDFVSIKERFDTSSPMGRAMMYIASVFSQLERETIAERIRDNMRELSKTGRWLGGTSPTGYESEGVQSVTLDGKTKKAYKLKIIPGEAETVRLIYKMFLETNSLSKTETYFIQRGYRTKNNKLFTRFALRNILTNPVYLTADADAFTYLTESGTDLFAEEKDFDGRFGVMAYNRTVQKPGKTNQTRPMGEWIVAVGKHPGLIPGAQWVKAQVLLEQNKPKSFRKPKSGAALLSGLLRCECGGYMRPKASKRVNGRGEYAFSYLCEMKEKSRSHLCGMKNVNGNELDKAVLEEAKKIGIDRHEFACRLALYRNRPNAEEGIAGNPERLKLALAEKEKEISALVSALANASGTSAEAYIVKQIEGLHGEIETFRLQISERERDGLVRALSNTETDSVLQLLGSFENMTDEADIEQKRAALRLLVKRIVWDGEKIHVYLYGAEA